MLPGLLIFVLSNGNLLPLYISVKKADGDFRCFNENEVWGVKGGISVHSLPKNIFYPPLGEQPGPVKGGLYDFSKALR